MACNPGRHRAILGDPILSANSFQGGTSAPAAIVRSRGIEAPTSPASASLRASGARPPSRFANSDISAVTVGGLRQASRSRFQPVGIQPGDVALRLGQRKAAVHESTGGEVELFSDRFGTIHSIVYPAFADNTRSYDPEEGQFVAGGSPTNYAGIVGIVPEPATLGMLCVIGAALIRRTRA